MKTEDRHTFAKSMCDMDRRTVVSSAKARAVKISVWTQQHGRLLRLATWEYTKGAGQDCTRMACPRCYLCSWSQTAIFSRLAWRELVSVLNLSQGLPGMSRISYESKKLSLSPDSFFITNQALVSVCMFPQTGKHISLTLKGQSAAKKINL